VTLRSLAYVSASAVEQTMTDISHSMVCRPGDADVQASSWPRQSLGASLAFDREHTETRKLSLVGEPHELLACLPASPPGGAGTSGSRRASRRQDPMHREKAIWAPHRAVAHGVALSRTATL
jgi:hypothetical protein